MEGLSQQLREAILEETESRRGLPHDQNAREYEGRASPLAPGEAGRAAWLTQAGQEWELAGALPQARRCYQEAVTDGGSTLLDPRAELLGVLFALGETDRADALLAELRRSVREGSAGDYVHTVVGETLELSDRPREALAWFDAGLVRSRQESPGDIDMACLNGHYRVRRTLGLPLDRYDELAEEHRTCYLDEVDDVDRWSAPPSGQEQVRLTVLYWPPEELARLLQRWPVMAEEYGADHAEHRALVEKHLRGLAERHPRLCVATGVVDDLLALARERGEQTPTGSTRASYAAHVGRREHAVTAWPPRRDDRCWCDSGKAYADCCGAPPAPADPAC